jgi:hypothetical protein
MDDPANAKFKYDVAISFQAADEVLATEIVDLLQGRFSSFIYLEKQDELAGRDGEKRLGDVFFSEARVVVVLIRPEWGQTPFTRIEETAIRNRAFNEGYDFTLFVPTTIPATVPQWLPKTRLCYGLERFGVKGLAAVVERLIEEQGASVRVESLADRAARFERAANFRRDQETFACSVEGVRNFEVAAIALQASLVEQFTALKSNIPSLSKLNIETPHTYFVASGCFPVLIVLKRAQYSNRLDTCEIDLKYYDGFPNVPGYYGSGDAVILSESLVSFGLVRPGVAAYILGDDYFSPWQLAEYIVRKYLDIAENQQSRRRG